MPRPSCWTACGLLLLLPGAKPLTLLWWRRSRGPYRVACRPRRAPATGAQLLERVAALEAAVAQLQRAASTERVKAAPRSGDAPGAEPLPRVEPLRVPLGQGQLEIIGARHLSPSEPEPLPMRRLTPAEAAGLLTTPEVGQALGLASDSALTNWIAREAAKRGGTAVGGIYRGHRLRGKGLLPGGQKPGWLWKLAN